MKILLISPTNNIQNGRGNITHELCMFLKGKVDFTLLLPSDEKRYGYTSYPVEYILPPHIFSARSPKIFKFIFFRYTTDADIIHSLFEFPHALIGALIAGQNKKPFIVGTQGTYAIKTLFEFPDGIFLKWIYNRADIITAPSTFTADNVKKYSKTSTPIKIIHNAVNFERFSKNCDYKDIQNKYLGKKILMTVGGLKPRKGQDIVLKALSILKKKRSDFHYLMVGPNEERSKYVESLHNIIKSGNLEHNVTMTDAIDGIELVRNFHASDIYIHTPTMLNWNFEGFGIVYLEASACTKPIIASDSGGIRDAVIENETGLIVPENDILATAEAIEKLLDNNALCEKLGIAGYEYAKKHRWEIIGNVFIKIYKDLLR